MSGITPLIVTPGLELLFPQTPVFQIRQVCGGGGGRGCGVLAVVRGGDHVGDRIQRVKLTGAIWRPGDPPADELPATPFIMLLIHSAL